MPENNLNQTQEENNSKTKLRWENTVYQQKVDELYLLIEALLSEYQKSNLISFKYEYRTIIDPPIGIYPIKQMKLFILNEHTVSIATRNKTTNVTSKKKKQKYEIAETIFFSPCLDKIAEKKQINVMGNSCWAHIILQPNLKWEIMETENPLKTIPITELSLLQMLKKISCC